VVIVGNKLVSLVIFEKAIAGILLFNTLDLALPPVFSLQISVKAQEMEYSKDRVDLCFDVRLLTTSMVTMYSKLPLCLLQHPF